MSREQENLRCFLLLTGSTVVDNKVHANARGSVLLVEEGKAPASGE